MFSPRHSTGSALGFVICIMIPNTFKAQGFKTGHPHLGSCWTSNLRTYAGHIMWKQKVKNDMASKNTTGKAGD